MQSHLVFFDLETSGLDPDKHAIIQIGAISVRLPEFEVVDQFEAKVQFSTATADKEALAVNSYDADVWAREAKNPYTVANEFREWVKKYPFDMATSKAGKNYNRIMLAGHNVNGFDIDFLVKWYKRLKKAYKPKFQGDYFSDYFPNFWRGVDTLDMAVQNMVFNGIAYPNHKLETLCQLHDIALSTTHDALDDIYNTVALCQCLRGNVALSEVDGANSAIEILNNYGGGDNAN